MPYTVEIIDVTNMTPAEIATLIADKELLGLRDSLDEDIITGKDIYGTEIRERTITFTDEPAIISSEERVLTLEVEKITSDNRITFLEGEVSELDNRLTIAETAIVDFEARITALEGA